MEYVSSATLLNVHDELDDETISVSLGSEMDSRPRVVAWRGIPQSSRARPPTLGHWFDLPYED